MQNARARSSTKLVDRDKPYSGHISSRRTSAPHRLHRRHCELYRPLSGIKNSPQHENIFLRHYDWTQLGVVAGFRGRDPRGRVSAGAGVVMGTNAGDRGPERGELGEDEGEERLLYSSD